MASRAFLQGVRAIVKGDVDFDTATLKVMLMATAPSTTNLSAWATRSAMSGEFSAAGYTAGGVAQAFTLNAADTANHKQTITLTNITGAWTGVTWGTPPVGAVVYVDKGAAASDIPLWWVEFSSVTAPAGGEFPITYSSAAEFVV